MTGEDGARSRLAVAVSTAREGNTVCRFRYEILESR